MSNKNKYVFSPLELSKRFPPSEINKMANERGITPAELIESGELYNILEREWREKQGAEKGSDPFNKESEILKEEKEDPGMNLSTNKAEVETFDIEDNIVKNNINDKETQVRKIKSKERRKINQQVDSIITKATNNDSEFREVRFRISKNDYLLLKDYLLCTDKSYSVTSFAKNELLKALSGIKSQINQLLKNKIKEYETQN